MNEEAFAVKVKVDYVGGTFATIIVLFFLERASNFEKIINKRNYKSIRIRGRTRPGFIGEIGTVFGQYNIIIKNISIQALEIEEDIDEELLFTLKFPHKIDIADALSKLYRIEGINEVMLNDERIEID